MTLSVTINGMAFQVETGMTVLEAAQSHGIYIPTLCYAPKLRPAGACRMCLVEIKDTDGFPTACTVLVSDGMVVRTETKAVQTLRREILSLILAEHPYTCLICQSDCADFQSTVRKAAVTTGCQYCPANGQCELQKLVDYLDLTDMPYPINYRGLPVEQNDPFFDRDYNLCVLCGRCVRACQEIRHAGVLAFVNRGGESIVSTAFGRSHLEICCQFCGACVDVCPTGALADKRSKWEGVPTAVVPSVCPYCSVGCAVNIQVKEDRLIRAVGHQDGPANDGQLCVRGRYGMVDVVHSPSRLKTPMVRRNGRLVEVSWDEVLDVVGQHLSRYRSKSPQGSSAHQPGSDDQFAMICSASATNEESYALQKFARVVMQSNNVALASGFPATNYAGDVARSFPLSESPTIRDVRNATCILAIGTSLFESHPVLGLELRHALAKRRSGSEKSPSLIAIDARQSPLASMSDVWLQPRVATDHVLLVGITKALAQEAHKVSGPSTRESKAGMANDPELGLDEVARITGVEETTIAEAARQLARSSLPLQREDQPWQTIIIYGSGITHHSTGVQAIMAIHRLAAQLGNAGIMGVFGEGNFVGAHDMGVHPAILPGYHSVSDPEARATYEVAWGTTLNATPGRDYEGILDGIRKGHIRALYLAGEMPPMPELSNLEFLVVQNIVTTESMKYAHVLLPATSFAEMDGTLTNLEGRVQRLRQTIPPVGQSRPGWAIACAVAQSMGEKTGGYQSASQIMDEISKLVPAYANVSYQTLDVVGLRRLFKPVPEKEREWSKLDSILNFTSDQFPFALITERNLFHYHGACLTDHVRGMNLVKQEEILYLSPEDARRLGVSDGGIVKVTSSFGGTECIIRVSDGMMPEGVTFASFNRVNGSTLFPNSTANLKAYAVQIEAG